MNHAWSRRDILHTLAAAAGLPALGAAAAPRRRVGIIGGGMAGVSLAWLLDGACDVVLVEARPSIGGNIRSLEVTLDNQTFVVDLGAQFFHPAPYPLYTALLSFLGLYPPSPAGQGPSRSFPASITLAAAGETTPRFVSPIVPDREWPIFASWNQTGLAAFARAFAAAKQREQNDESWALTLEEWLPSLGIPRAGWEGAVLPWAASLFSGTIDEARGLSARAAMIFAAKALPDNPLDPILYYVLDQGLIEVLDRLLAQTSTVSVLTNAPALAVSRDLLGRFVVYCAGQPPLVVDDLVLAASGPATLSLLGGLAGTTLQRAALAAIEFRAARLALHATPSYAPSNPLLWSFLNSQIAGPYCEASMWLAPVLRSVPLATSAKLWKSWTTHRNVPPATLAQASFVHLLPTPATITAQNAVRALQGIGRIWLAGGYLSPYDSQETALRSALGVALGLNVSTSRTAALAAAGA
ncbi:MAG TPA: NAD(P)-binding protein [Vicinamibacterales bacterium]|nr:NAD(P)-binding protein [Vicinamibacterales bacterium]